MPNDITARFVTNLVVQTIEGAFRILFFEAKPEIHFEGQTFPKEVPAECVASIIVTRDGLAKFVEVFQRQLDLYNERTKPKE